MSLTQTAQFTRRAVAATIILLVILTVGRLGWNTAVAAYLHFFPPQKPPPEVKFGKLPAPEISSLEENVSYQYVIDTTTGRLPSAPDRLPVFPLLQTPATPMTEQKAKALARRLGFLSEPQIVKVNEYHWSEDIRTLKMNIVSQNFILETEPHALNFKISRGTTPTPETAERLALNYLTNLNLETETLSSGRRESIFVRINRGELESVESKSQAQLTRVDLRKILNIDNHNYEVLGESPKEGLTHLLVTQEQTNLNDRFPLITYQNWEILTDEGSTYPLLEPSTAWGKLQNNEANVVYLKPQTSSPYQKFPPPKVEKMRVQEITLAYFEGRTLQKYLIPIFVYEGLAEIKDQKAWEFVAYLPAVTDEWLYTSTK